jgi:hypothetical protein
VIVGEDEIAQGAAAIKALRPRNEEAPFARQSTVPQAEVGQALVAAMLYQSQGEST